jgi:hypothetical protein
MPTAALLWYLVIFEPDGGLIATPTPFQTAEECEAAMTEFQNANPTATWDLHCMGPDDQ